MTKQLRRNRFVQRPTLVALLLSCVHLFRWWKLKST